MGIVESDGTQGFRCGVKRAEVVSRGGHDIVSKTVKHLVLIAKAWLQAGQPNFPNRHLRIRDDVSAGGQIVRRFDAGGGQHDAHVPGGCGRRQ